jgi:tRNA G10  N-methylase Trm11
MSYRHVPRSATVFTPPELAAAMVAAARGSPSGSWLDPCIGDGAFVAEMAKQSIAADRILGS